MSDQTARSTTPGLGCPACDLLLTDQPAAAGKTQRCPRCGTALNDRGSGNVESVLALCLTGLLLYLPAMLMPLMSISMMGHTDAANLVEGVAGLFLQGYWPLALVFSFTAVLAPLLNLLLLGTVAFALHFKRGPRERVARALRWYGHLREWGMLEVYMIGILVAAIKLLNMADVRYGFGLAAFVGLLACTLAAAALFNRDLAWQRIERELV